MTDWVVVLAALCGGVALTCGLAARQEALDHPTTRLFRWLVPASALLVAVVGAIYNILPPAGQVTRIAPAQAPGTYGQAASPFAGRAASDASAAKPVDTLPEPAALVDGGAVLRSGGPQADLEALEHYAAAPPRLRIPSLDIDQPIMHIAMRDGQWDLGPLGLGIGWLATTGAHPGDDLAMAFIGHMTLSAVQRGPFAYLQKIAKGAEVIYQSAGMEYVYAVREKGRLPPYDVTQLYFPDGQSLLLVTCTDWDFDTRTYANRLLVRASLVEQHPLGADGAPDDMQEAAQP